VPNEDAAIAPGAPVCTVSATARTVSGVRAALATRAEEVLRGLAAQPCTP
jgi:predicted ATP-grasp superfamily ATP-dependent carboligase